MLRHYHDRSLYPPGSVSLLEFDDHYDEQRLCYALFVNKVRKRITVVFRGTYADGTNDWKRNLQIDQLSIPVPHNLQPAVRTKMEKLQQRHGPSSPIAMKVHHGVYEYLFRNTDNLSGSKYEHRERYEEIVDLLRRATDTYPNYKIYVTGHSMGGNLAKLFAFYLSTSRTTQQFPKPVTCICVGSPVMGDVGYSLAMTCAEELGWLRHLSIKNEGDAICYMPPMTWYEPSGMHLRLHRHGGHLFWHPSNPHSMDRYHDNTLKSLLRVLKSSFLRGVDLLDEHLVPTYLRRLEREKDALSKISLNELYNVPEIMGAAFLDNVEDLKKEEDVEEKKRMARHCSSSEEEYLVKE
jgi:hypothetical protein